MRELATCSRIANVFAFVFSQPPQWSRKQIEYRCRRSSEMLFELQYYFTHLPKIKTDK